MKITGNQKGRWRAPWSTSPGSPGDVRRTSTTRVTMLTTWLSLTLAPSTTHLCRLLLLEGFLLSDKLMRSPTTVTAAAITANHYSNHHHEPPGFQTCW